MRRPRAAFTLIELLVVIGIIALLVALLLPALTSSREMSRRSVCQSQLHQLAIAFTSYVDDDNGNLPWSWTYLYSLQTWTGTDGDEGNGSLTGGLLDYSACVPSFQSPTAPGTYPAYGAHLGPFRYYPYVNNDKVYSCPTLLALNTPKAFYVDNPAPMLLYSHYRQNPYFGHQGYGAGNLTEYPGLGDGQENIPYLNKYRIKAAITDVTQPANSVLDYEASQYDSLHDFQQPWLATPATVAFNNAYQGGDRRLVGSYTASSGNLSYYVPNIGFHHTDAGNFSYLDGHVGSLNYKAVLTDTNDTIFLLRK